LPYLGQGFRLKGDRNNPFSEFSVSDEGCQGPGSPNNLQLGVDREVRDLQNLLKGRHPLPHARIEPLEIVQCHFRYRATAVGRAIYSSVMHYNKALIAGQAQVELHRICPLCGGAAEGA
jgi:hypothetical protein